MTTCHLHTAICHLPSAICHQLFAICYLPSAICHPPSAIRNPAELFFQGRQAAQVEFVVVVGRGAGLAADGGDEVVQVVGAEVGDARQGRADGATLDRGVHRKGDERQPAVRLDLGVDAVFQPGGVAGRGRKQ